MAEAAATGDPTRAARKGPRSKAWRRFTASRTGVVGAWLLIALYLVALLSPFLAPHGITVQNRGTVYQPPHGLRIWH